MGQPSNIIVVYGPTASGKTNLSLDLAEQWNGEIINVDSRQIYCGLDIGTGKIQKSEMRWIPHHCLDILQPIETPSAWGFRDIARPIIDDIFRRWKTPILCGWTGLYIDTLIFDQSMPSAPSDEIFRKEMEEYAREHGSEAVWNLLQEQDPEYASELHPNNLYYVIRALEVLKTSGASKASFRSERILKYPGTVFVTPYSDRDREALYARIDERVRTMFASWLCEETKNLLAQYGPDAPWLTTIGYRETVDFLLGRPQEHRCHDGTIQQIILSLEDTTRLVAQRNRNYAKRQISWNKRYKDLPHLAI